MRRKVVWKPAEDDIGTVAGTGLYNIPVTETTTAATD